MSSWKDAEREVALFFGGTRRVRIDYSESVGDIQHERYSIEVKYGKQIPKYLQVKIPTCLICGDRVFDLDPSKYDGLPMHQTVEVKNAGFLLDAMDQAKRYNPTKEPLVCVKPRSFKGFVICRER